MKSIADMTREQHLDQAHEALTKAANLADTAEYLSRGEKRDKARALAAAGALWNDVALTHIELARELRETPQEQADA